MPATLDPIKTCVLLGLLEESPLHGYEIKTMVEERFEDLEMSAGSLYYMLKKLERRGWVKSAVSRNGNRPERRTYRITAEGRGEFRKLLEKIAFESDRLHSPFDVALYFVNHMDPEAMIRAIDKKLADLDRYRHRLRELEEQYPGRWPFHLYYLREKAKDTAAVMERWCLRLRRKLREKEKSWSTLASPKNKA